MPKHESLLQAAYAPYSVSSSVTLDTLYRGRDLTPRTAKANSQLGEKSVSKLAGQQITPPTIIDPINI